MTKIGKKRKRRPIVTPEGRYETIDLAAERAGISLSAAKARIHDGRFGWRWDDGLKRTRAAQCHEAGVWVDGFGYFRTITAGAKAVGISPGVALRRIRNGRDGWRTATPDERTAHVGESCRLGHRNAVSCPQGVFPSLTHAAKWAGISLTTASRRVARGTYGWKWATPSDTVNLPDAPPPPPAAKPAVPVFTPQCVLASVADAAKWASISTATVESRIYNGSYGWRAANLAESADAMTAEQAPPFAKPSACRIRVYTPQCVLESIAECAKWASVSTDTVRARIAAGKFGWRRATPAECENAVPADLAPPYVKPSRPVPPPKRTTWHRGPVFASDFGTVFASLVDAARKSGIAYSTARRRLDMGVWRAATADECVSAGFEPPSPLPPVHGPVVCPHGKFRSLASAAKMLGIPKTTLAYRVRHELGGWKLAPKTGAEGCPRSDDTCPSEIRV